jgi:hypothetical protein
MISEQAVKLFKIRDAARNESKIGKKNQKHLAPLPKVAEIRDVN